MTIIEPGKKRKELRLLTLIEFCLKFAKKSQHNSIYTENEIYNHFNKLHACSAIIYIST